VTYNPIEPVRLWTARGRNRVENISDIDGRVRTVDFVFESHRNRFLKLNTAQFKLERKAPKSKHKFKGL